MTAIVPSRDEDDRHHRLRLELAGLPYRPLADPRSHHVVLKGMRFHYLEWGDPHLPPVLLLHGGGQTCRTWDLVCHELSTDYRCIAPDLRGHGDSEWSYEGDYRLATLGRDVSALVRHLELDAFALVGMSMGCASGLHHALHQGAGLRAFVAVDAGPWVRFEGAQPILDFMQRVAGLEDLDAFVAEAHRFNPRRDPRLLRRSLLYNLRECPDGRLMWKGDLRPKRDFDRSGLGADLERLRERLPAMPCPTLIARGAESRVFLDEDAARFAAAVPDGRWVRIPDAGHTVQGDQPRALIEAIREFFTAIGF